jgi:hypothetical protein
MAAVPLDFLVIELDTAGVDAQVLDGRSHLHGGLAPVWPEIKA